MTNQNILQVVKRAIHTTFGEFVTKEAIDKSVYLSQDDPGGWSPSAAVIINTENGLPSDAGGGVIASYWYQASDKISEETDHYIESINSAIMAVYPE